MPARMKPSRPHKRKGFWCLVRRVPTRYRAFDTRGIVILSTGIQITDDPRANAAHIAVAKLDADLFRYWRDLEEGRPPMSDAPYKAALETARNMGLEYLTAQQLSRLPIAELLHRVDHADNPHTIETTGAVAAVLGGHEPPPLLVSGMRAAYEQTIAATLAQKSERQLRRWRLNRDKALATFIDVIGGDRPVISLKRTDILAFRTHWQDRIMKGEVEVDTGNMNIGRIGGMFRVLNDTFMLALPAIFDKTNIAGGNDGQRIAFTSQFVQANLLAEGAFANLNPEARRIIYLLTETGLRLSEATNLQRHTILLEAPIPHVSVKPDGREMKTDQSRRDIPLVGVALMAMREQPDGFPRYPRQSRFALGPRQQGLQGPQFLSFARTEPLFTETHLRRQADRGGSPREARRFAYGPQMAPTALRLGAIARTQSGMAQAHRLQFASCRINLDEAAGAYHRIIPASGFNFPLKAFKNGRIGPPMTYDHIGNHCQRPFQAFQRYLSVVMRIQHAQRNVVTPGLPQEGLNCRRDSRCFYGLPRSWREVTFSSAHSSRCQFSPSSSHHHHWAASYPLASAGTVQSKYPGRQSCRPHARSYRGLACRTAGRCHQRVYLRGSDATAAEGGPPLPYRPACPWGPAVPPSRGSGQYPRLNAGRP